MGYPNTGCICLGTSCKIQNRFYTKTQMLLVLKSKPNPDLKLHKFINTILDSIWTLYHEHCKIKLLVTYQTSFDLVLLLNHHDLLKTYQNTLGSTNNNSLFLDMFVCLFVWLSICLSTDIFLSVCLLFCLSLFFG